MNRDMYYLIKDTYTLEGEAHIGYGIGCSDSKRSSTFEDLTTDQNRADTLIEQCNKLHLSPIHLEDVVEDFLVGDL